MSHSKTLFALAVAGTVAAGANLVAAPVLAADLDGSYPDISSSVMQQQVSFGSGWYVRGDIAANKEYQLNVLQPPDSTIVYRGLNQSDRLGYDLSLGGGYSFTNSVRGDITVDFHQPVTTSQNPTFCFDSASNTCNTTGRFASYDAMVNAYYDFGPFGVLTPYVGAGVGVGFGTVNTTLAGGTTTFSSHSSYHNLAWAAMAGVAIDVYAHTKLDIGYRYIDNGTVIGSRIHYNEVRAGLRYMIDN